MSDEWRDHSARSNYESHLWANGSRSGLTSYSMFFLCFISSANLSRILSNEWWWCFDLVYYLFWSNKENTPFFKILKTNDYGPVSSIMYIICSKSFMTLTRSILTMLTIVSWNRFLVVVWSIWSLIRLVGGQYSKVGLTDFLKHWRIPIKRSGSTCLSVLLILVWPKSERGQRYGA